MEVESGAEGQHPHQKVLEQVESFVAAGDYEAAIELLYKAVRETGDDKLTQRLVFLRIEAESPGSEMITPEPMYEANELLNDAAAVRARLEADGYLFFRNIIPVERLLELRNQITTILAEQRWIEDGAQRMRAKAISRPRREGQPKFFRVHDRIIKLEALHSLAHDAQLMKLMRLVLGETAFPHPLCITRLIFPDSSELSTPPHQDYPNNQGTPNLTAAWIPLGDVSMEDGSLAIKEGSHKFGVLPLDFHLGAGNRQAVLSDEINACRWVGADFKSGDIVLFPALTIHRALDNRNLETMRLSVDFRFQLEEEALTPLCLQPHFERVSWEDIYKGWKSKEHQYYWKNKDYVEVPWNPALHALPEEGMFEAYLQELQYNVKLSQRQAARAEKT